MQFDFQINFLQVTNYNWKNSFHPTDHLGNIIVKVLINKNICIYWKYHFTFIIFLAGQK